VYSDGLMAHSPTRDRLPGEIYGRITRLHHLDLLPGVEPLLLREYGVPAEALPAESFTRVVTQVRGDTQAPETDAVILGQYLSSLGIIGAAEEAELHASMLRALYARGCRRVVFKPHPAVGRRHAHQLRRVAAGLGVELTVAGEASPAEVLFAAARPALVVGCFSTALMTARKYFGLPVATMGLDLVMERLTPYENSNRIPVTIVDATVPRLAEDGTLAEPPPADLPALVDAVAYCMQSEAHPELREAAVHYLTANGRDRYFRKKRLEALGLMDVPMPRRSRLGRFLGTHL
jgi:hypothetical protein